MRWWRPFPGGSTLGGGQQAAEKGVGGGRPVSYALGRICLRATS